MRFIAINNGTLKDTSKKIRAVMKSKGEAGKYFCTSPPYGYMKNPDSKKRMIVDGESAEVVNRIFSLCLECYGLSQISCVANHENRSVKLWAQSRKGACGEAATTEAN